MDTCQCQTRVCNNPPPENGGATCSGSKIKVANCTVHGNWTPWSPWSACSQTCGFAIKTRRRTCTNPAPAFGGRVCVDHDHDEIVCIDLPPCPTIKSSPPPTPQPPSSPPLQNGQWSSWGPWGSCNGGIRVRERSCDKSSRQDINQDCIGCNFQIEHCNSQPRIESRKFSSWTPWYTSTNISIQNISGYTEKRFRYICKAHTDDPSSIKVELAKEEERFCRNDGSCSRGNNVNKKNIDIPSCESLTGWDSWSKWSACDDLQQQYRKRICLQSQGGGCQGVNKEVRDCLFDSSTDEIMTNALPRRVEVVGASMGAVVGGCLVGFIMGLGFCSLVYFFYLKKKKPRVPGSPHYISKQNPYVAVPLKEVSYPIIILLSIIKLIYF